MPTFDKRLQRLEKRFEGNLLLLCRMPDGTEQQLTIKQYLQGGAQFIRIAQGQNCGHLEDILRDFEVIE